MGPSDLPRSDLLASVAWSPPARLYPGLLVPQAALLNLVHRPKCGQVLVLMRLAGFVFQTVLAWWGHSVSLRPNFILSSSQLKPKAGVWEE